MGIKDVTEWLGLERYRIAEEGWASGGSLSGQSGLTIHAASSPRGAESATLIVMSSGRATSPCLGWRL